MTITDLARIPGAFQAQKLPIPVHVAFAKTEGTLDTNEGMVAYEAGAALLTGRRAP